MQNQRRPLLYYWLMALVIMGLINMFLLPFLAKSNVQQVSYDVFLTEMENKNISTAEVNADLIYFVLRADDTVETETLIAAEKIYSTVRMDDPMLIDRLDTSGAAFTEVRPKQVSPWVSSFIMFIIFFLLWRFVMSKMMARMGGMGGNAMAFGKANAKIYVKAQTGKTFADVAGQDEAKEALREIVDFLHNPEKYAEVGATMPKGARKCRFSLSPAPNLWKCLSAWARQRCAICSSRQTKKLPALFSLTKLTPLVSGAMATAWAATMNANRR